MSYKVKHNSREAKECRPLAKAFDESGRIYRAVFKAICVSLRLLLSKVVQVNVDLRFIRMGPHSNT